VAIVSSSKAPTIAALASLARNDRLFLSLRGVGGDEATFSSSESATIAIPDHIWDRRSLKFTKRFRHGGALPTPEASFRHAGILRQPRHACRMAKRQGRKRLPLRSPYHSWSWLPAHPHK
jgi:hypothetical protein